MSMCVSIFKKKKKCQCVLACENVLENGAILEFGKIYFKKVMNWVFGK